MAKSTVKTTVWNLKPTPVTKVGGYNKKVGWVGQVMAQDLAILCLLARRQRPNQDWHDGEVSSAAGKTTLLLICDYFVDYVLSAVMNMIIKFNLNSDCRSL